MRRCHKRRARNENACGLGPSPFPRHRCGENRPVSRICASARSRRRKKQKRRRGALPAAPRPRSERRTSPPAGFQGRSSRSSAHCPGLRRTDRAAMWRGETRSGKVFTSGRLFCPRLGGCRGPDRPANQRGTAVAIGRFPAGTCCWATPGRIGTPSSSCAR